MTHRRSTSTTALRVLPTGTSAAGSASSFSSVRVALAGVATPWLLCPWLLCLGGCNFDHLRHKPTTLSERGGEVVMLKREEELPAGCEYLRDTSTTTFQGDMRIKLANNAANYGGNLVHLRASSRLMADGRVYRCPPAVLGSREPIRVMLAQAKADKKAKGSSAAPKTAAAAAARSGTAPAATDKPAAPAASASHDAEARGIFLAGKAAYEDSRYEAALGHFKRAYELSQRPALLFNIGQAADKLRRDGEALEAFRAYLEQVPDGEGAREAESRVRILEGK